MLCFFLRADRYTIHLVPILQVVLQLEKISMFAVHMYPRAHVIIINIVINIRVLQGRSLGTPMVRACFVKTRNNIVFEFFFFLFFLIFTAGQVRVGRKRVRFKYDRTTGANV